MMRVSVIALVLAPAAACAPPPPGDPFIEIIHPAPGAAVDIDADGQVEFTMAFFVENVAFRPDRISDPDDLDGIHVHLWVADPNVYEMPDAMLFEVNGDTFGDMRTFSDGDRFNIGVEIRRNDDHSPLTDAEGTPYEHQIELCAASTSVDASACQ